MTHRTPMDIAAIQAMTAGSLADYLWRRLRLEEPLDPPLDHRFGREPPEEVLITAWQQGNDPAFTGGLISAIRDNLTRVMMLRDRLADDPAMRHQLASLGFLAKEIDARELVPELTLFAQTLWTSVKAAAPRRAPMPPDKPAALLRRPLFHLIDAVSDLTDDLGLIPFWQDILAWSGEPGLRSVAYYGLSRADPKGILEILGTIVDDPNIRLSNVAWNLAQHFPGVIELGKAARKWLDPDQYGRLRAALVDADAGPAMLRAFEGQLFIFALRLTCPRRVGHRPRWGGRSGSELESAA